MEREKVAELLLSPNMGWGTISKKDNQKLAKQVYWSKDFTRYIILSDTELVFISLFDYLKVELSQIKIEILERDCNYVVLEFGKGLENRIIMAEYSIRS